jgi:hypothetical protein
MQESEIRRDISKVQARAARHAVGGFILAVCLWLNLLLCGACQGVGEWIAVLGGSVMFVVLVYLCSSSELTSRLALREVRRLKAELTGREE